MSLPEQITIGKTQIDIPITAADRIINYFSPTRGNARYRDRVRQAINLGGYSGADRSRRANQQGNVREMDADSAILPDLATLREDSQHLIRNNAIAGGSIKTNITKVVGTGLKAKAQIDRDVLGLSADAADAWERAAEREYRLATETREIDAERQLPFSLFQGLAFLKSLEDGDVLINMPRFSRPGSPYKLKLQMIEAARICNPRFKPDNDRLAGGVSKDASGGPTKYHVLSRHPGNMRSHMLRARGDQYSWHSLKAFDLSGNPLALHLFDKVRPGQTRGVPYLAPVVELIKQLGRYTDAEVMAAVVTGMLTVFVTNESGVPEFGPAPTQEDPYGEPDNQVDTTGLELGYGSVIGLQPGEKVETASSTRPNTAFDAFVQAILRQIGVALELPFELLIKHFTSSYSASRAAFEEAWDYFHRRRMWLTTMLCQPVYEAVISEAVARGRLSAPGFFADPLIKKAWLGTNWIGDAPSQLDPKKEIEAARGRIDARLTSRSYEYGQLVGGDWERQLPQIAKEEDLLKDNGLQVEPAATPTPDAPNEDDQ